jgi:hypothetical protein
LRPFSQGRFFLTADEIYAIDELTEVSLPDYLLKLPDDKRELVSHIFNKNRAARAWKVVADEKEAGVKRLAKMLEENGVRV